MSRMPETTQEDYKRQLEEHIAAGYPPMPSPFDKDSPEAIQWHQDFSAYVNRKEHLIRAAAGMIVPTRRERDDDDDEPRRTRKTTYREPGSRAFRKKNLLT